MNENAKCNIKSSVILSCCKEDIKCKECMPEWQRTIVIDESGLLWFPVIGVTNKVLRKLVKSEGGMLIDRENGTWYVDEQLALEISVNKKEYENLVEMCKKIKDRYAASLEQVKNESE